jgi:sulfite exporter TauE/SafE
VSAALVVGALLLGFGGSPHCAAMCGAPCAALTRGGGGRVAGFHGGRMLGYMAAGALAAASVSTLGATREAWPVLRPLWALLHVAVLALGLWLLVSGRKPEWRFGRAPGVLATAGTWVPMSGPSRAGAAGLVWVAWPCGLLYGALTMAALADGPLGGAAVMAAFSIGTLPALAAAPLLLNRLTGSKAKAVAVRAAGALLAGSSAWALGHGVWERVLAWCVS